MSTTHLTHHSPWNKGKLIGQKPPLKLQEIWSESTVRYSGIEVDDALEIAEQTEV